MPNSIKTADGQVFTTTVLKVLTRDDDGSPRTFQLLRDDESTEVAEGDAFEIVYSRRELHEKKN